MQETSTTIFLIGLLVGTVLLLIGLGLGIWLGQRTAPSASMDDSLQREQLMRFVRNFANWTNDFAGDFTKYQVQLQSLTKQAESTSSSTTPADVQKLLQQIISVNRELENRLQSTEERLENQTKELAGYLTEARTDGLTGLSNRRAFDQLIESRYVLWTKESRVFCLAIIDIDYFKKINDTYGHQAGDTALQQMAQLLKSFGVDGIEVARYGGEEFAVMISQPLEIAAASIDKFRKTVQNHRIEAEGKIIPVTISVGVAQIQPDERPGKVMRRADEALYAAKTGGRNRVYIHDGKLCRCFGIAPPPVTPPSSAGVSAGGHAVGGDSSALNAPSLRDRVQQKLDELVAEEAKRH